MYTLETATSENIIRWQYISSNRHILGPFWSMLCNKPSLVYSRLHCAFYQSNYVFNTSLLCVCLHYWWKCVSYDLPLDKRMHICGRQRSHFLSGLFKSPFTAILGATKFKSLRVNNKYRPHQHIYVQDPFYTMYALRSNDDFLLKFVFLNKKINFMFIC